MIDILGVLNLFYEFAHTYDMSYSDSFHDTGSTQLTSHIPTRVSDNSQEGTLSYSAAEGTGGAMIILASGVGARVTGSTGHVLSNVATPTSTFTDTTTFTYKPGGNQNSNIGATAFDNGGTGSGLTCYTVRINLSNTFLNPTVQIVRIVNGSGSAPATYTLGLADGDIVELATTYTLSSQVDLAVVVTINGTPVHTLTYTDSSPIDPVGTFLGFRGDGPNNSDSSGMLLFSRNVPTAGPTNPTFTLAPTTATTGAGTVSFTLTGSNTSWTGGTTATLSGGTGASVVSQSISGQVITAVVNLGTTSATLAFGDTADIATATATIALGNPNPVTGLVGVNGNNSIALSWTAPTTGGTVATYNLYRGTSSGAESGTPLATGLTSTTYTDSTAVNGTAYFYKMKSVNAAGLSGFSSEAGGYTPVAPPTNLTIEETIFSRLNYSTITTYTSSRIYNTDANEGTDWPFLVYTIAAEPADLFLGGATGRQTYELKIDTWSKSVIQRGQLGNAIKARLHIYVGGIVDLAKLSGENSEEISGTEEGDIYHGTQSYIVYAKG